MTKKLTPDELIEEIEMILLDRPLLSTRQQQALQQTIKTYRWLQRNGGAVKSAREKIIADERVKAALEAFPGSEVESVNVE